MICLEEGASFQLVAEDFKREMRAKWGQIDYEEDKANRIGNFALRWRVEINGDDEIGELHSDLRTITIDGYPEGVAAFAIWYRGKIPTRERHFVTSDSADHNVEVAFDNTEQELVELLNSL